MHTINVESEQVDAIVISELKMSIDGLKVDLECALNSVNSETNYLGVWSHNPETDALEIQKHVDALELIVKYYNGESTIF
jgi:hypothetical protein